MIGDAGTISDDERSSGLGVKELNGEYKERLPYEAHNQEKRTLQGNGMAVYLHYTALSRDVLSNSYQCCDERRWEHTLDGNWTNKS